MKGAKSRLTAFGAEPFFIPELDLNESDDKLKCDQLTTNAWMDR